MDYLKSAKYFGIDRQLHPVTVDGAVAHELAHIAFNTSDEEIPVIVEGIITASMGTFRRLGHAIVYQKNSNGGFVSLAHKAINVGSLGEEFADKVRMDFAPPSGDGPPRYDTSKAQAIREITPPRIR